MSDNLSSWFAIERKHVRDLSPACRLVFLECLERARYNGNRFDSSGNELELGQLFFGREEMSKRCGLSQKQVRTAVKILEKTGLLKAIKSTTRGPIATIANLHNLGVKMVVLKAEPMATNIQEQIQEQKHNRNRKSASPRISAILEELNKLAGTHFEPTSEKTIALIEARFREHPTLTTDMMLCVVRVKCREWGEDPKMRNFLRPQTLFGKEKFENYLSQAKAAIASEQLLDSVLGISEPEILGDFDET